MKKSILGIRTIIIYFALCLLISLKATKIIKIFVPVIILFYDNNNVCVVLVGWFLYALLLLKIIFNMKRLYMDFLGCVEKCVGFMCILFKVVKNVKSIYVNKLSWFSPLHTTNIWTSFYLLYVREESELAPGKVL